MEYLDWLIEWVYNSDSKKSLMDLPVEIQKKFKKKNNYILYRGLKWNDIDVKKELSRLNDNIDFEK